jgi:lysophospholipase L1-like esterase
MPQASILLTLVIAISFTGLVPLAAQDAPAPKAAKNKAKQKQQPAAPDPSLAEIKDEPGLPRVLLIGDSISIGYTLPVRELLRGKANVHRIATNGGPTTKGLTDLDHWLGDGHWDVIHFNWGLHDLKLIDGKHQVPIEDYEKNLGELVKRLEGTGAKLVWCSTTPVPTGAGNPPRRPEDVPAYNRVARKIMAEHGIAVDDLYGFAAPRVAEIQRKNNVHFTPKGSRVLAGQVAASIQRALASDRRASATPAKPELVAVARIWDRGPHNAFTDLIRFHDRWFCAFRESDAHVGGDGRARVLASDDGSRWESSALVAEEGIDLRDPKLSITPEGKLMIVAGGSVYQGTKQLKGRQPRVMFSPDGKTWSAPKRVLSEGEWLWRVTWHGGRAYGVSYTAGPKAPAPKGADPAKAAYAAEDDDWKLRLVASVDGIHYETVTRLGVPGRPNETTLRVLANGEMMALVRREAGSQFGWIGTSRAPYRDWSWHEIGYRLGGPNFIQLPDGSLWAASRCHEGGVKTVLARMDRDRYEPALSLPSGGDSSYPGMVWHDGLLWMSYYSSHEGKSSIYLARIKVPLEK